MTNLTRNLSFGLLLGALGAVPGFAQSGPAEYPPASYTGSQYVDSKGCVYVRAGYNGNITWVPRVARNREPVCGFQPTQVAGATKAMPVPDRRNVTVITAAVPENGAPATAPVASVPAPAPVAVAAPKPAVTGPVIRTRAAPAPVIAAPAAPVAEARPRAMAPAVAPQATTRVTSGCSGLSDPGRAYIGYGNVEGVRCGPQADYTPHLPGAVAGGPRVAMPGHVAPHQAAAAMPGYDPQVPQGAKVFAVPRKEVKRVAPARVVTQDEVATTARVMPKHVYENKLLSQEGIAVPKGYRPVWEDDRLNPYRAEQTLQGKRQMEMVWTQTVPRRLVPVEVAPARGAGRVSSQGVAPQKVARSGTYVQIGTFRTPANARNVAQKLAANGLPVQLRASGTAQVVLAGPFADDRSLGNAMTIANRAGFADAFIRR